MAIPEKEDKLMKKTCYECKYRDTVPGNCHSSCKFPGVGFMDMISKGPAAEMLNIKGTAHGIKNGWFHWPINFDPVWLENCDGFQEKGGD